MRRSIVCIYLFVILVIALSLRLYNISNKAIWYDEADSIYCALKPASYFTTAILYKPLYFLLLKAWVFLFNASAFSGRLLSAILSTLNIVLIYKLGRVIYNRQIGLIACLLLAFSCFNIFQAQQIRYFSMGVFYSLLSYINFIYFINTKKRIYLVCLALINFVSILTHPYANALIFSEAAAYIFIIRKLSRKDLVPLFIMVCPSAISVALVLCSASLLAQTILWIPKETPIATITELFSTLNFGGKSYGLQNFTLRQEELIIPLFFSSVPVILFCSILFSRMEKIDTKRLMLLTWFFIPPFAALIISLVEPIFLLKHLIFISIPYYLLLAYRINKINNKLIKITVVLVILFTNAYSLRIMYKKDYQNDWRCAAGHLKSLNPSEPTLVIVATNKEVLPLFYYFKGPEYLPRLSVSDYATDQSVFFFPESKTFFIGLGERMRSGDPKYVIDKFDSDFRLLARNGQIFNEVWILFGSWANLEDLHYIYNFFNGQFEEKTKAKCNGIELVHFFTAKNS